MTMKDAVDAPFKPQGEVLEAARKDRKLTFKALAKSLNTSIGRCQNWIYGHNRPEAGMWAGIKIHLGVDCQELYYGEGVKAPRSAPDPAAMIPLIESIERNLMALKAICMPGMSDKAVEAAGIKKAPQHQLAKKKKAVTS